MDSTLDDHERRLAALNGNIVAGTKAINKLSIEVATTRTRVGLIAGIAAGLASIAGSGLAMVLVYLSTGS